MVWRQINLNSDSRSWHDDRLPKQCIQILGWEQITWEVNPWCWNDDRLPEQGIQILVCQITWAVNPDPGRRTDFQSNDSRSCVTWAVNPDPGMRTTGRRIFPHSYCYCCYCCCCCCCCYCLDSHWWWLIWRWWRRPR